MTQSQINPLRLSASLILNLGNQEDNCHKYLTLIRNPHMSFANAIVFPGGVCENIDVQYTQSKDFKVFSKITAIRQTVEETGILILPPNEPFSRLEQFKAAYKHQQFGLIQIFLSKLWAEHLDLIRPVLRLATPQVKKMKRYDCIFYVLDENVQKINLGTKESLQDLEIGISESKSYFWKEPQEYLTMFVKGNLQLAPPQRILFSILNNLRLKDIKIEALFNDKTLQIEPILFQFTPKSYLLAGDGKYKGELVIKNEPQSSSSKSIKDYLDRLSKTSGIKKRRISIIQENEKIEVFFDYQGECPEPTIFKYLLAPSHKPAL